MHVESHENRVCLQNEAEIFFPWRRDSTNFPYRLVPRLSPPSPLPSPVEGRIE